MAGSGRHRAARRAAVVLAGVLSAGSLVSARGVAAADDPATPAPVARRAFEFTVSGTCSFLDAGFVQHDYPATVRTAGTAPASVPIRERFTVDLDSVTVTVDTDAAVEPLRVGYVIRNDITQTSYGVGPYDVARPAPQHLAFTAGVNGPFALSREVSLHLSVTRPGAPAADVVDCSLQQPGSGLEIPLDLPADGSLRPFDLRADGMCGFRSGDPVAFRLAGVVSTSVAPGESVRLIAEHGGPRGDIGQDSASLSVSGTTTSGSTGPVTIGYPIDSGVDVSLPPATAGAGAVTVRFAGATGLMHVFDPQTHGLTLSTYHCTFPDGGDPLVIPITGGPATTTSTTTTTVGPEPPLCRYRGSVPAWFWRLLTRLLHVTC